MAGSLRRESHNRRLLAAAVAMLQAASPVEIDLVAPDEMRLPLYDGDLEAEQGLPTEAVALRERLDRADGLLIACPEYNHSLPGMFKNVIDWISRPPSQPFADKAAAIMGAGPGGGGAQRSLQHLRLVLVSRGVWVVPAQVSLTHAADAFGPDGTLNQESDRRQVAKVMGQLLAQIASGAAAG